ncbi:MAG: amidohydrolase [Acidimicrobiia bacterium]
MSRLITAAGVLGRPDADSVVVSDGRVTAIGRAADLEEPGLEHLPRTPGVILTGLRDAHIHPSGYAAAVTGLSLSGIRDFADLRDRVVEAALDLHPGIPVVGSRLDENDLLEGRLPTRWDLDGFLENRPIVLTRSCGHVAVANSAALQRAGVGPDTADPPEGTIDRDARGRPTGVLRETAIALVSGALAADSPSPGPEKLLAAVSGLASLGITGIDAIVSAGTAIWCGTESELDDIIEIAPDLPIGLSVFVTAATPAELERSAERLRDAGVTWAGLKAFSDGSLGGHTAALDAPYADHPSTGTLRLEPLRDVALAEAALDMGGTVAIHAIGDRANAAVLDLFASLKGGWADPARFRVEHASVLSPELVARFADLGVTASVQPAFIASEVDWLARRLGAERTRWTYPLRSLDDAGVPLIAGSDSPVEDPNPWPAIAAAATNPITPEESLGVERALAIFGGRTPMVGDTADLIVVDQDPNTTEDLAATTVLTTYVGGASVTAPAFRWPT